MKLIYQGNTIFINDNSEIASKIQAGFDYHLDAMGRIVIDSVGTGLQNKYQVKRALATATTVGELRTVLIKMVELLD